MPPPTSPDAQQRMHRVLSGARPDPTGGVPPPDDRVRTWVVAGEGGAPPGEPSDGHPPPGVPRRAAIVAVILAVVALVVAVPRALFTEPDVEPVPQRSQPAPTAAVVRATGDAVPAAAPSPADVVPLPTPGGAPVFVHVVGQVRHPGLVRLESGARLADALRKAGGPTRRADLARVNLARLVTDGEQIFVPRPGQAPPVAQPGPAGGAAASPGPSAPVDLNTADEAALDALPGVGPVIAGRIVAWRQEHGRFTTVEELTEVSGIGDATLDRLRPLVRT